MASPMSGPWCCICFTGITPDDCYVDRHGVKWDMCAVCGPIEDPEGNLTE